MPNRKKTAVNKRVAMVQIYKNMSIAVYEICFPKYERE
jgi:hypothetical protein